MRTDILLQGIKYCVGSEAQKVQILTNSYEI